MGKTVLILSLLLAIAATALAGPRSTAYSLTIELSDGDIKFLNEIGYSICIVRDVVGFDLSSVWHAIPPRQLSQETCCASTLKCRLRWSRHGYSIRRSRASRRRWHLGRCWLWTSISRCIRLVLLRLSTVR